ncbi:hypothetical protein LTR94_011844 [Friedmanniomyces endolithicus]|nr:hypothetical protein LTR94_011844 [Friedmanniomyces endolithicus]
MALKLSLKPGEKFVLNGAVVQNGDRRGVLILQNRASVLREKDIMQADEVTTPARRIYFPIMMMYLDEASASKFYDEMALRITEFMGATKNPDVLAECVAASRYVLQREYYKALMAAPAATRAETPRDLEYRLFGQVTRALVQASKSDERDLATRIDALDWNRRLWSALAADCGDSANALPQAVRAQIISLSLFVNRHSSLVMRGEESFEDLIDINRMMMQGLAPGAQQAA